MFAVILMLVNILFAYGILYWIKPRDETLNNPIRIFAVWVFLFTFEYFALGPFSFIYIGDEGELIVAAYHFYAETWNGGQYIHGLASGDDATAGFIIGGAWASVDGLLFNLFPVWLAIFIHKALVSGIGFAGIYLLCRDGFGVRKIVAASAGALFTVGYFRLVNVTFGFGFGFAVMPLGMYVLVYCHGQKNYWIKALLFAGFASMVIVPTQSALAFGVSIITAMALLRKFSLGIILTLGLVTLGVAFNWAESMFGMVSLGAGSLFGQNIADASFASVLQSTIDTYGSILGITGRHMGLGMTIIVSSWLFAGIILVFTRDKLLPYFALTFVVPFIAILTFLTLPWELLHLEVIRGVTYSYMSLAILPGGIVALAYAIDLVISHSLASEKRTRTISLFSLAAPLGVLAWYKIFALWQILTVSGQGMYWTVDNLKDQAWKSDDLYRTISLQHANLIPEPNLLFSFYNLEMFDAYRNFPTNVYMSYWQDGISPAGGSLYNTLWLQPRFIDKAQKNYRMGDQADLTLLGAANVRYILSPIPLKEDGLRLVDGPVFNEKLFKIAAEPLAQSTGGSQLEKLIQAWDYTSVLKDRIFSYGKVYVYELDRVLPRAWAAVGALEVPDDISERAFLAEVSRLAFARQAVVRAKDVPPEFEKMSFNGAKVISVREVRNGYDVDVEAPDGGLIVVNAEISPFFRASVNGRATQIFPVNGVQTGIVVPKLGTTLSLRYSRPTLWRAP